MFYTALMKEKKQKNLLKSETFPFRFTGLMLALLILLLALCATGIGLTTWQFTDFLKGDISSVYDWMKYVLLYLVSILLAVIVIAMLIRSQYIVTDNAHHSVRVDPFALRNQKYLFSAAVPRIE